MVETCKSWLYAKNLPKALWAEGMKCAKYVINRIPLSPINMKMPFEQLYGEKPTVKYLRVFGSICYVHVPESQRSKLDAKAKKCIFVGYDERKKGWKCMDPATHKSVVSRDVVFDELSAYYSKDKDKLDVVQHEMTTLNLTPSSPAQVQLDLEEQSEKGSLDTYENT